LSLSTVFLGIASVLQRNGHTDPPPPLSSAATFLFKIASPAVLYLILLSIFLPQVLLRQADSPPALLNVSTHDFDTPSAMCSTSHSHATRFFHLHFSYTLRRSTTRWVSFPAGRLIPQLPPCLVTYLSSRFP
jgi:hypothetical protein